MPTWDDLFGKEIREHGNGIWKEPHEGVVAFFDQLKGQTKPLRILDLGCGTGRHLIYLETCEYVAAYGMDISPNGLLYSRDWLNKKGYPARLTIADMASLPYVTAGFDIIISTYVIHHNLLAGFRKTIQEIQRILKPGGTILISIPSNRGYRAGSGNQVEAGTVIPDIGKDRGIPHRYTDLRGVAEEFESFIIRAIRLEESLSDEGYLSSHWFIQAEKPG